MGKDGGGLTQGPPSRVAQGGLAIHAGDGSIQPRAPAEVVGGGGMTPGVCPERADWAKKSLKLAMFRRKQR